MAKDLPQPIRDKINKYATGLSKNTKSLFIEIIERIEIDRLTGNKPWGKYHWNYKGGVSSENKKLRNGSEAALWRKVVFLRDDFTCQKCLKRGGVLHAHHIKPFSEFVILRFDPNNGVTLCKSCHHNEHKKSTYANQNVKGLD